MDIEHQEQAYMKYLIDDLEEYAQSDYYPFHMPGHKRKSLSFPNPYEIDITEIDGFDNLHHATGMIKEAEVRGAELYHSKRCFFLVRKYLWASGAISLPRGAGQGISRKKLSQSSLSCIIYE